MKTPLIVTALLTAGMAFTEAQAANQTQPVTQITVRYDDLDLSKPAGAEAMLIRLKRAAERACGYAPDARAAVRWRYNRCFDAALADAVEQLDAPLVSALHTDRHDRRIARNTSEKN